MSLVMMEGFDTVRTSDDLTNRPGWVYGQVAGQRRLSTSAPSVTGVAGFSLRPLASYVNNTATVFSDAYAPGSPSASGTLPAEDFVSYDTGVTVNRAYTAGGWCFGASAKFFQTTMVNPVAPYPLSLAFDGTLYWRLDATYNKILTSPDLVNWTLTPTLPQTTNWAYAVLSYAGNGVMAVMFQNGLTSQGTITVYYTSNQGQTWQSQNVDSGAGTGSTTTQFNMLNTGIPAYPLSFVHGENYSAASAVSWRFGTIGGSFVGISIPSQSTNVVSLPKVVGNYGLAAVNSTIYSFQTSLLGTGTITPTALGTSWSIYDIAFCPGGNCWVLATASGVVCLANGPGGTSTNPVPPTSATALTLNWIGATTTNNVPYRVFTMGNNVVALGINILAYTTNGTNWTANATFSPVMSTLAPGVATYGGQYYTYYAALYDGTRLVASFNDGSSSSSAISSGIVSSVDGINDWTPQFFIERASTYVGTAGLYNGLGVTSSPVPLTSAMPTGWTAGVGQAIICNSAVQTSATQVMAPQFSTTRGTAAYTASIVGGQSGNHYYEILALPDSSTVNNFFLSFYIDGAFLYTSPSIAFGTGAGDTVSRLIITFPRTWYLTNYDDVYMTLQDGVGAQGPYGTMNIQTFHPTADVQKQWTPGGNVQSSNAATVNHPSVSQATGYVTAQAIGTKDVYSTNTSIGKVFNVIAAQVEAWGTKGALIPAQMTVGLKSGTAEVDSAAATVAATNTYVSKIAETDPATGQKWTQAGIAAADITLTQVG